jgi:hypothetical protein
VLLSTDASPAIQLQDLQAQAELQLLTTLGLLEQMDRQALIAQRGSVNKSYQARTGDTWESVSVLFYGGLDGATLIKNANGIRLGQEPVPGMTYQIPALQ